METTELRQNLIDRFGEKTVTEWEKTFAPRALNVIQVEDKICVLRPVTAKEVATFSMLTADEDKGLDVASRYLLAELWLDGDNELKDDEEYFISAMLQLQQVVELKKSSFSRLSKEGKH